MKNPRYANEIGILLDYDQPDMPSLYVDSGELYDAAVAGQFGAVAAYTPPPAPTPAELLAQARASASLTRREFFLALDAAGMYDQVMALLADPLVPRSVKIELETATSFERNWPSLISMASSLGITDKQIDAIFNIGGA